MLTDDQLACLFVASPALLLTLLFLGNNLLLAGLKFIRR